MSERTELRDEIIAEVRAVREAYAARFGYDVTALFRHARERARQSDRVVVTREPKPIGDVSGTP